MTAIRNAFLTIITILLFLIAINPAMAEKNLDSITVTVTKGHTFNMILESAGINKIDAKNALEELSNIYDPSQIFPGQIVKVNFEIMDSEGKEIRLSSIDIKLSKTQKIQVTRLSGDIFIANILESKNQPKLVYIHATVATTLFSAAMNAGISHEMFNELVKAYSFDVDFQRDVKRGNELEVLYEGLYDSDDNLIGNGDILYASLKVNRQNFIIYRYTTLDSKADFYTKDGKNVQKTLLKTPVNGARISSSFGRRHHPILGYTKMHKGIDFAAPRGTPIYAAGSGRILEARRNGGYGNFIKIYHSSTYTTAYAHLNGYAKNIRRGSRVNQGQVIGYVGTTGRSTGPHLHFEVRKNGQHVNPLTISSDTGKQLASAEKKEFFKYRNILRTTVARMKSKSRQGKRNKLLTANQFAPNPKARPNIR